MIHMSKFAMNTVLIYASKRNLDGITAGRCNRSVFLFITDLEQLENDKREKVSLREL